MALLAGFNGQRSGQLRKNEVNDVRLERLYKSSECRLLDSIPIQDSKCLLGFHKLPRATSWGFVSWRTKVPRGQQLTPSSPHI